MQAFRSIHAVGISKSLGLRSFRNISRGIKSLIIAEHASGVLLPGKFLHDNFLTVERVLMRMSMNNEYTLLFPLNVTILSVHQF